MKGIDISYHNGDFDLARAKNEGYNFVIIRAGYTGYGEYLKQKTYNLRIIMLKLKQLVCQ